MYTWTTPKTKMSITKQIMCSGSHESILFIEDTARSKQKNKSKVICAKAASDK